MSVFWSLIGQKRTLRTGALPVNLERQRNASVSLRVRSARGTAASADRPGAGAKTVRRAVDRARVALLYYLEECIAKIPRVGCLQGCNWRLDLFDLADCSAPSL